ncbi:MAG: S41 family peptidase [Armatimonadota bacterium]|nr:S41 family peptidase [Armatimonadota bacterium]MDR7440217.1 S41 family peptidase [Armatimonadota bacterium]MDR7563989.1 S41 family peptidase [Armatimonadota bacterium]MDR7568207.1 S41 family peptidase [Armatimonadota bacterium]MDR7602816.1 S41 family peptidase [Armatimonadota bacterium]
MRGWWARVRWIGLGVTVAVVLAGVPAYTPAQAADASVVFAALNALVQRHVDEPDPIPLLRAALEGVLEALRKAGIPAELPDLRATDFSLARWEFQQRFDEAADRARGRLSEEELQYAAARAMAASLGDSHTGFLSPQEMEERRRQQFNEAGYTGIGILLLSRSGRFYVRRVFPGSPAERAGLRDFDRILAIDGQPTERMSSEDVSNRIRGPGGTTVTLTVQRAGHPEPLTFPVVRAPIVVPTVETRVLPGQVGYLRFSQFTQGSSFQLRQALQDLLREGVRGLLLDLRGNPGGFVAELNRVADYLLGPGLPLYTTESRSEGRTTQFTRGPRILPPDVPLVVLVDEDTASAAELLSAALQEHGRGILVGTRTSGAVLISITVPLPGGAGITVAIARLYTPRGVVLEKNGLAPDVAIDLTLEDLDRGVDAQLVRAQGEVLRRLATGPVQ